MPMLVSGLLAGFVLGVAAGGNWRNLAKLDLKFWPALFAGVIARTVAPLLGGLALSASIAGLLLVAFVAGFYRAAPRPWPMRVGAQPTERGPFVDGGGGGRTWGG